MVSRAESAAATRAALLHSAAELLARSGPDGVTLRGVAALAGVSRGAPYGHFRDKEQLLVQLAIDGWNALTDELDRLRREELRAPVRLERALSVFLDIGRGRPHLYALMFTVPADDPGRLEEAAARSQQQFLAIVADIVRADDVRLYGALLMSAVHGIVGMDGSGHLAREKWRVTPEELLATLISTIVHAESD